MKRHVWPAVLALLPITALGAPDEEALGKARGYPLCQRHSAMRETHCFIATVSRLDEIYPARMVAKSAEPLPLKRAAAEPKLRYTHQGFVGNLDHYLARNRTTGLLILRHDTILVERYQYERKPEHRMNSYSMAKTIVALLVGIALHEQKIASLDDRAEQYVAELKGTQYGATPIRHLLTMSSGIAFNERHDGTGDNVTLGRASQGQQGGGGAATVEAFSARDAVPGQRYNYASADTQVLGLVLRGATGKSLSEYLAEKVWQPMGAEAEASWIIDRGGYETAFTSFSATLRDWARLGLLLANDGALDGRQIIPAGWLKEMTSVRGGHLRMGVVDGYFGYGYQTWLLPEGQFALSGFRGQMVFVDPKSKLVMVHTAAREARDPGYREQVSLWHSVVEQLSGKL